MVALGDVAVSTVLFDGHPRAAGLALVAEGGLRWVEPALIPGYGDATEEGFAPAEAAAWRRDLAAHGLLARAVSAHLDLGAPGAAEGLGRRLRFAAAMGAATVVTNAGSRADEGAIRACLDAALPLARDLGVALALENPGHGAGALLPDGAALAAFVEGYGDPRLRANYDPANAVTYAGGGPMDLHADLRAVLPLCPQLHLKDLREAAGGWDFCALGEGFTGTGGLLGVLPPALPLVLELPLRLARHGRAAPRRGAEPVPFSRIAQALRRSVETLGVAVSG